MVGDNGLSNTGAVFVFVAVIMLSSDYVMLSGYWSAH